VVRRSARSAWSGTGRTALTKRTGKQWSFISAGSAVPEDIAPLTLFEVTIARTISPDGEQGMILSTPEKFSFVEVLGLLEAAKWQLFRQMSERYGR
jgi:hypothetical protein